MASAEDIEKRTKEREAELEKRAKERAERRASTDTTSSAAVPRKSLTPERRTSVSKVFGEEEDGRKPNAGPTPRLIKMQESFPESIKTHAEMAEDERKHKEKERERQTKAAAQREKERAEAASKRTEAALKANLKPSGTTTDDALKSPLVSPTTGRRNPGPGKLDTSRFVQSPPPVDPKEEVRRLREETRQKREEERKRQASQYAQANTPLSPKSQKAAANFEETTKARVSVKYLFEMNFEY